MEASVTENWILLSKKAGETATEERIEVSVDWQKYRLERKFSGIEITSDRGEKENAYISVFNPSSILVEMDTLFVEQRICLYRCGKLPPESGK